MVQNLAKTVLSQALTVFENPGLLVTIFKKIPFEERGKLSRVANSWNAAIDKDAKLFNRSMNTLLTIMNTRENNLFLRFRAVEASGRIGNRASVEPLTAFMNNPAIDQRLRIRAGEALGRIGDPSALQPL